MIAVEAPDDCCIEVEIEAFDQTSRSLGAAAAGPSLHEIARALGGEISGDQVRAPGPGHSSKDRSLSIKVSADAPDGFVVNSFTGDDPITCKDYVRSKLDLPPFKSKATRRQSRPYATGHIYEYRDPSGALRYRKERFEFDNGDKSFQIIPKGRNGSLPLLYGCEHLADIGEGQTVWIVEGENKVEAMRALGAIAVSADTGAKSKWLPGHARLLRGLPVILWPDSDEAGERYITNAAAAILAEDPSADIKVVRPFGKPNGAKSRDVCDWEGDIDALAADAKPWQPAGDGSEEGERPARRIITFTPFVYRDPTTIPKREWVYGKHYIRKFLSGTLAPGGGGKSSLDLVEAVAMAAGINLLGVPVPKQLRVVYWNGEDPVDEIERRIGAIIKHFRIDPKRLEGWLFTDSGRLLPIRIAEIGSKGTIVFTTDADALTDALISLKADVFIADPFVKTHGAPENDNGAIDQIATRFATVADEANSAVELAHHVRKAGGAGRLEVTVDDGRGAGSFKDAARDVRIINTMTVDEANIAQVKPKDRRRYFRIDSALGKANMTPPAEAADWYRFVSVPLCNDPEFPGTDGDSIGVVTKWELPGTFAGLPSNAIGRVQTKIASGDWGKNPVSADWAGYAIADALGLSRTADKERCKLMLKSWLDSEHLATQPIPSKTTRGEEREGVVVGRIDERGNDEGEA
jgi:hypothetical protein